MLVALAIAATIATIVYGSYTAATRSVDACGSRLACCDRACLVLRLMARQVRCAWAPPSAAGVTPERDGAPRTQDPLAETTDASPAFDAARRDASGTILSFLTTGGLGAGPDRPTPISRVTYRYDRAYGLLAIGCEPFQHGAESAAGDGQSYPVLSGVRQVDLRFHDGQQWRSEWQEADGASLPRAVQISLTVVDERDRLHELRAAVPIACWKVPQRQPQATEGRKL